MNAKADTRIFRMTRAGSTQTFGTYWPRTVTQGPTTWYGNRRVASAKCGGGGASAKYGPVIKVEATNAEATDGWTDVTSEFIKQGDD